MSIKLVLSAWGVLRNHTCCGNEDTASGRWHVHTPGHSWNGIDVPSNMRLTVDPDLGPGGLVLINLLPEAQSETGLGIGSVEIGIDETLASRGVTTGPSVVSNCVRMGFGRNLLPLSPYSSYVKGDATNTWFKYWKAVSA